MTMLNFDCEKCRENFTCDVGKITFAFTRTNNRPTFEKEIRCTNCQIITMDDVILTESGQTKLTDVFMQS